MTEQPNRTQAPATYPLPRITMPAEHVITIANGIVLHTLDQDNELCRVMFAMHNGDTCYTDKSATELAAFMMRQGGKSTTPAGFSEMLDFNGCIMQGSASSHYTTVTVVGPSHGTLAVLPQMIESVFTPSMDSDVMHSQRQRMATERARQMQTVSFQVTSLIKKMMAGETHPLAVYDTPDMILAVSDDAVRRAHSALLSTATMHVFVAGGDKNTRDEISKIISEVEAQGHALPFEVRPFVPVSPSRQDMEMPQIAQAAVALALPIEIRRDHPDYLPLRVAVTALGGFFGSRLMTNIREEKGYTYGIDGALYCMHEGADVRISAQCDAEYVEPLIEEVRKEVRRMSTELLTADEMRRLKLHLATYLAQSVDNVFNVSEHYSTQLTQNIPHDYFERHQDVIESISAAQIAEISQKYLDERLFRVATIVPNK